MHRITISIAVVSALSSFAAFGSTITYTTCPGCSSSGGPVSVQATFTTTLDTLTVDVANLFANPSNVTQLLSDLAFELSDGALASAVLTSSSAPTSRTVNLNGTFSDVAGGSTGWLLEANTLNGGLSAPGLRLCDLCAGAAGPSNTIIGPSDASNIYAAANNSITGNGPHNPFLFGTSSDPVHFVLNVPGVTSSTTVTAVNFSFGTAEGNNVPGVPGGTVPEPASMLLIGGGLLSLGLIRRRSVSKSR